MSIPVVERARAKVNLHLHVTGRRADGYHLLDSLAVFAAAHDELRAAPLPPGSAPDGDAADALRLSGPFGATLSGDRPGSNLVIRAAAALRARIGAGAFPVQLALEKHLPVASGIGGGSADAAAALRALRRLWGAELSDDALRDLAAALGADVPVCVSGRPALMGGIGEILLPAPALPPCGLLLVNPGLAVSTPAVFRARAPVFRPPAALPAAWTDAAAMADTLRALHNDLQDAAVILCPPIGTVLAAIAAQPDALLARMSGSGATCFGLFARPDQAETAARALRRDGWWCAGGPLAIAEPACLSAGAIG